MGVVQDLQVAIETLHVPTPIVLVGHSLGALIAYAYAARYSKHCAGLILIDPSDPSLLPPLAGFDDTIADSDEGTTYSWQAISHDIAGLPIPTAPAVVIASAGGPVASHHGPRKLQAAHHVRGRRAMAALAAKDDAETSREPCDRYRGRPRVHSEAPDLVANVILAFIEAARSTRQPDITAERLADLPGNLVEPTGIR